MGIPHTSWSEHLAGSHLTRLAHGDSELNLGSQLCGDIENSTKTPSPTPDMHTCVSQKPSRAGVYMGISIKRAQGNPYSAGDVIYKLG